MRLTTHTDFALRVLLYVGAANESVTISKISETFSISKDHLRKVVHTLSQLGYLKTTQGRNGGIRLAQIPETINIKDVVGKLESLVLVECFDEEASACAIDGMCGLKKALFEARESFLKTLATYHLSDFIQNPKLIAFCHQ